VKILHITFWPGPPFSGLNVNCYNFLKRLTPKHSARFIVIAEAASNVEMTGDSLAALGIPNEELFVIRHRSVSALGRVRGLLLSRSHPYLAFWENTIGPSLRESTASIVRDWEPDALVVWSWAFAEILAQTAGTPKILYACDSVSLGNRNSILNTNSPMKKAYHRLMAPRCRQFEQEVMPLYDHVIFISRRDADQANLPTGVPVSVITNGVDTSLPIPTRGVGTDSRVIVFHGNFGFLPNSESLDYLIRHVGPTLAAEFGPAGFEIRIFGSGVSREHLTFAIDHPWLKFYGYVEDVLSELAVGNIYAAPIVMGAGVKNKILDAMISGLPVVGTEEAFSGIDVLPGVHVIVCSRDRMADEMIRLLRDPERCSNLGKAARQWVGKNLDWDKQAVQFESVLAAYGGVTANCSSNNVSPIP
jgi:glycosyltransferase involved in cell wall biosynthesis